ncbi:MAG: hypothetical protein WCC26_09755 [Terracidiphilus sp.]
MIENRVVTLIEIDVENTNDIPIAFDGNERFNKKRHILRRAALMYFIDNRSGEESFDDLLSIHPRSGRRHPLGLVDKVSGRIPDPKSIDVAYLARFVKEVDGLSRGRGAGEEGQNVRISCNQGGNPGAGRSLRVVAQHPVKQELAKKHSPAYGESDANGEGREFKTFRFYKLNEVTFH